MSLREQVEESLSFLKGQGFEEAEIGIILGTGLGGFINEVEIEKTVEYSDIPNFPVSTVEFHKGKLVYAKIFDTKIVIMQGRFHYYEGYNMRQITFPLYVLKELGIKKLLISNAAGNLNLEWNKGDLMLVDDHINLLPENPLRGINDESFGPRFPDMSRPYDQTMNALLDKIAEQKAIELRKGVYVSVEGPNLETRAEYRYLSRIGADAVGMSTVPEVIVSNYLGIPVSTISVLTDNCDPDNLQPADINEIIAIAKKSEEKLTAIFKSLIQELK